MSDPLGVAPEEMRRLGYWVVDRVVEHFEHGAQGPVTRSASAVELRAALGGPVPQLPGDPIEAMQHPAQRPAGAAPVHDQPPNPRTRESDIADTLERLAAG